MFGTNGRFNVKTSLIAVVVVLLMPIAARADDFMVPGQQATINKAGNGWPCFSTPEGHEDYWNSKANGDRYGMQEALRSGSILLRPGWHVRLIRSDFKFFGGQPPAEIRIESGHYAGRACYVKYNPAGIVDNIHPKS